MQTGLPQVDGHTQTSPMQGRGPLLHTSRRLGLSSAATSGVWAWVVDPVFPVTVKLQTPMARFQWAAALATCSRRVQV